MADEAGKQGPLIARGRTAEVYAWGEHRVLKLILPGFPATIADREAQIGEVVYRAGVGAPRVDGTLTVDGRAGIVYERVDGPSMGGVLVARPWTLFRLAGQLAELHAAVHRASGAGLPSRRERLQRAIAGAPRLSGDAKAAVLQALARLPDGDRLCHGDFHPFNVLMAARGPVLIDWLDAASGPPAADVARTILLLTGGALPPGTGAARGLLLQAVRRLFCAIYLRRYLALHPLPRPQPEAWRLPVAAARLSEHIPEEERALAALVDRALKRRPS